MPTFDIVSKVPWHEVANAVQQAQKEIATRFDFRGTGAEIDHTKEDVVLRANAEDRVKAILDVFKEKMVKRKVSLKHLDTGKVEPTGKQVEYRGMDIIPIRDGLVARKDVYSDGVTLLRQLGLTEIA